LGRGAPQQLLPQMFDFFSGLLIENETSRNRTQTVSAGFFSQTFTQISGTMSRENLAVRKIVRNFAEEIYNS
jgi:hypothetical protein